MRMTSCSSEYSHVVYFNTITLSGNGIVYRIDILIISFRFRFGCTHVYLWICSKNPYFIVRLLYLQMSINRILLSLIRSSPYDSTILLLTSLPILLLKSPSSNNSLVFPLSIHWSLEKNWSLVFISSSSDGAYNPNIVIFLCIHFKFPLIKFLFTVIVTDFPSQ